MKTRIKNMDTLFKYLNNISYGLETQTPSMYYKLCNNKTFSDYLKNLGCVNESGEVDYEKYEEYGKSLYKMQMDGLNNIIGGMSK